MIQDYLKAGYPRAVHPDPRASPRRRPRHLRRLEILQLGLHQRNPGSRKHEDHRGDP